MNLCLIPGHGGADPGACANGLVERQLTSAQAWWAAQVLDAQGHDVYVCPQELPSGQKMPNAKRMAYANDRDAVAVSLHFNAGGGKYGLVCYALGDSYGRVYAERLRDAYAEVLKGLVSDVRVRAIAPGQRGYVCVANAERGAVLSEPLFLDNAKHAEWLRDRANRVRLWEAVAAVAAIDGPVQAVRVE